MTNKRRLTFIGTAVLTLSLSAFAVLGVASESTSAPAEPEAPAAEEAATAEATEATEATTATEAGAAEAGTAESAETASAALFDIHPEGLLDEDSVQHQSTSIACHTRDSIGESGEGALVDPNSGLHANPHANHQYLACVDCHAPTGQSVMYCNSCHEFDLAPGWTNPEMGGAELAYLFDVGGLDLDWESTDREKTVLTPEQIAPYSVADSAEGVDQNQGFFAK